MPHTDVELPQIGEFLAQWRLAQVVPEGAQIRLSLTREAHETVQFRVARLGPGVRRGPFDMTGLSLTYGETKLSFDAVAPLGSALHARLARLPVQPRLIPDLWRQQLAQQVVAPLEWHVHVRAEEPADAALLAALDPQVLHAVTLFAAPAVRQQATLLAEELHARGIRRVHLRVEAVRQPDRLEVPRDGALEVPAAETPDAPLAPMTGESSWQERARRHLLGRPELSLRLGQLLDVAELPTWPCTLPWTRLEVAQGGTVGPCCVEYQAQSPLADPRPATALWNGPTMQAFRRAMLPSEGTPSTCRATCPVLVGQSQTAADVRLRGGPARALDSQIAVIEDMLAGQTQVRGSPLAVCLATTSFCNYDCLMCPCGAEGKLSDQLPDAFYDDLQTLLPGVLILEANGGEPLASPTFRAFLESLDAARLPQLQVNLITNGSYLTPKQLEKLARVPFGNLTLSLNAASPETYLLVNRGLPFARTRAHLDDLLARQKAGMRGEVTYSMVILKQNVHEIEAFCELVLNDGVHLRYMLPFRNRNDSSLLTDRAAMLQAFSALQRVATRLIALGRGHEARDALTSAHILLGRLDARLLAPL